MKMKTFLFVLMLMSGTVSGQQLKVLKNKQDSSFQAYVELFKDVGLPFSTYDEQYAVHSIDQNFVKKFICEKESSLKDWSGYDIEFSSCFSIATTGDFFMLIHDESTECGSIWKLTTYDYYGQKISELEIFAGKTFHGHREKDEVDYYDVQSIIDKDYNIEKKQFDLYEEKLKIGNIRYRYGRYIEYQYKIEPNGKIVKISEKDHGKQKYLGGTYKRNTVPGLQLAE